MSRPLSAITVVSAEQAVAAPFATRQLADLGARVIKIERPLGGDFARQYDETVHGQSSYFVWLNRGKESMSLDIKTEQGRAIMYELLGQADVFVQNLAPGAAARNGLDAATLMDRFPRLIPCTVSGYGTTGPWAHRKAYDLVVQNETGLVSVSGSPDEPAKAGISVADIAAGMYAYSGILAALYERAATGVVRSIDVSLFESLTEWMAQPINYTSHTGSAPARSGVEHPTIAPYGPYPTKDGTIVLAVQNDREWAKLCTLVLGAPELVDDARFAHNSDRVAHRAELAEPIGRILRTMDTATASTLLDQASIANGRQNGVAELIDHPVLRGRDRWREVATPGGPISALLPPIDLSGYTAAMGPVPSAGEHTRDILASLGCSPAQIEQLTADHVV